MKANAFLKGILVLGLLGAMSLGQTVTCQPTGDWTVVVEPPSRYYDDEHDGWDYHWYDFGYWYDDWP